MTDTSPPYKCYICNNKPFDRRSNFRSHMKKHNVIVPFKFSRKRKETEAFDNLSNFSCDLTDLSNEAPQPNNER